MIPTTSHPTRYPTIVPSLNPTTASPSYDPTEVPTMIPTVAPTFTPTINPTVSPTKTPSFGPTLVPTNNPTASPTKMPTLFPTIAPSTQALTILSFDSTIMLSNASYVDSSLTAADEQAIVDATASSMGLASNAVSFVSYIINSRKYRVLRDKDSLQYSSPGIVYATVSTSVLLSEGTISSQQIYLELTSALSFAIDNSTVFDQYLHTAAALVGSTAMTTATAQGVNTDQPNIITPDSTDDSTNSVLGVGALVGIIVGGIVGLLAISVVFYCLFSSKFVRPAQGLAHKGDGMTESQL